MIRLRKILLYKYFYYLLLGIALIVTFFRVNTKFESSYNDKDKRFRGIITSIRVNDDLLSLVVEDKNKEKISANYYFKEKEEKKKISESFRLGLKVEVVGEFSKIKKNTTDNIFNYQEYALRKRMVYSMKIESIKKVGSSKSVFLTLKNLIYKYIDNFKNGKYLKLILLGDKGEVSKKVINSFRDNGISHLFAISGMHVGVITNIILNILLFFKVKEGKRYLITCLVLFIYLVLIGGSPSIVRAFLFFILIAVNRLYYFHVDNINIFILTLVITLIINPYYIYDVGFQYSFLISFSLIISSDLLNKYNNYFLSLFLTSIISFLVSIPVTTYHFYQINLLGIIYNLFYVPFVTFLLFPLSLIVLICPFFSFLYDILINILEGSSIYLSQIDNFKLIFGKININYIFLEILVILLFLRFYKKFFLFLFLILIIIHYFIYSIFDTDYIVMLDVGQGDSFIIHSRGETVLIDTGGKVNYFKKNSDKSENNSIVLNTTIPYLKSKSIRSLQKIILTHGDYDHLGEALNLIDNFKIEEILINEGERNYLEKKIAREFYNVKVCREGDYFEIGNFRFFSINHSLGDENSSSIVLYIIYKNYKMLFMGDANFKSEEYLLDNYELEKVNILKLGHHGSKTSSSIEFLEKVRPDIALISAGRDNKFKHPNIETLERLKKYGVKFYSTQVDGTIEFNFSLKKIFT